MKKTAFLFTLFFCTISYCQDYTPLLANVNEWHFSTCFMEDCSKDVYYTDGDTLVNGVSYKILDGYHYISRTFLLREDITEKQVFLYTIVNDVEREDLLYDFSLQVGEEINLYNPYTPFPTDGGMFTLNTVEEVVLQDGNSYTQFNFIPSPGNTTSNWRPVWIEGVGSLSLVTAPGGKPNFDQTGELSCSFRDGNSIYANLERIGTCEPELNIEKHTITENLFIYPNPASNCFTIKHNEVSLIDKKVWVFDVMGKVVLEFNNTPCNDISNLSSGVYFVKMDVGKGSFLKKLVIQ